MSTIISPHLGCCSTYWVPPAIWFLLFDHLVNPSCCLWGSTDVHAKVNNPILVPMYSPIDCHSLPEYTSPYPLLYPFLSIWLDQQHHPRVSSLSCPTCLFREHAVYLLHWSPTSQAKCNAHIWWWTRCQAEPITLMARHFPSNFPVAGHPTSPLPRYSPSWANKKPSTLLFANWIKIGSQSNIFSSFNWTFWLRLLTATSRRLISNSCWLYRIEGRGDHSVFPHRLSQQQSLITLGLERSAQYPIICTTNPLQVNCPTLPSLLLIPPTLYLESS